MGIEHIDKSHQSHNEGVFRRLAGRGINTAMKFAKRYTRDIDPEMWESLGDHFPISANYEFAIKDVVRSTLSHQHLIAPNTFETDLTFILSLAGNLCSYACKRRFRFFPMEQRYL